MHTGLAVLAWAGPIQVTMSSLTTGAGHWPQLGSLTHGQATQRCAQLAVPWTQLLLPSSPAKPHMLIDQLQVL